MTNYDLHWVGSPNPRVGLENVTKLKQTKSNSGNQTREEFFDARRNRCGGGAEDLQEVPRRPRRT
jgi:hypothetical protein